MRWLALTLSLLPAPASAQDFTTLKGHGGPIMGLAVSPEGQVASASFDNSVGVWAGATPRWLEGHDAAVIAVDYSLAPLVLSGGDDFRVLALHPELAEPIELTRHQGKVAAIAVSDDAEHIATASWDGSARVLLVPQPSEVPGAPISVTEYQLNGHRSNVTDVAFARDGRLITSSSDGTLRLWEGPWNDATSRVLITHGFGINTLVTDKDWIAYGAVDGGTRVTTLEGEEVADFTLDRRPILAMAYHAPTHQLAVGDGHGYIMMIDTQGWTITRDFRAARKGPVWALAFSTDGETIYAGGLDDVVYAWPVSLLDQFDPAIDGQRSFLRDAATMPNGERQFMRKCSICHALEPGPSRKAGPTLHGVFGRRAGRVQGYSYSPTLDGSEIVWTGQTIDALFDQGPDHYIPGSKMPMQVIAKPADRADLITFLQNATSGD